MEFKASDWITIAGWGISFISGILVTFFAQRIREKKKQIGWTLVNESNFLSQAILHNIEDGFGVPLRISVRGQNVEDLSTIRVKIGNTGNMEVENITVHFRFGEGARVYVGRYIGDLGVYRRKLALQKMENAATLDVAHINCGQSFEVEFLVGQYQPASIVVDMAEAGVNLKKLTTVRLEQGLGHLAHISLGAFGVRYDPTATQTAHLAEEVRLLRQSLTQYLKKGSQ